MESSVLHVRNLSKVFKQRHVVTDVSFSLDKGEILGLLGPNGAGKTTTIQMLLGTLTPSQGEIFYFGEKLSEKRSQLLRRIGFASTYSHMPEHLTVVENLKIHGLLQGVGASDLKKRTEQSLEVFRLGQKRDDSFGSLSAGQKTRVLLAKAFLHNPDIVLLDEPTAALDPDVAAQIRAFILDEQRKRGLAVFFTSHNMDEISYLCDRVIVLKEGHLIANDSPAKLAQAVSTCYLHLTLKQGVEHIAQYAKDRDVVFSVREAIFSFTIDEQAIAPFLSGLAAHQIAYSHISIDKPKLEDYFIKISQAS